MPKGLDKVGSKASNSSYSEEYVDSVGKIPRTGDFFRFGLERGLLTRESWRELKTRFARPGTRD
jgi:hypothetical protein